MCFWFWLWCCIGLADFVVYVYVRNKLQKRVTAPHGELPPRDEQFILDFEQLQGQFPVCIRIFLLPLQMILFRWQWLVTNCACTIALQDPEQLRTGTETVIMSLVVQCSSHAPQSEFLLFAIRSLCSIGYLKWDTFLLSLLSAVSAAEATLAQGTPATPGVFTGLSSSYDVFTFHHLPLPCHLLWTSMLLIQHLH